jgi:hypothetical protein
MLDYNSFKYGKDEPTKVYENYESWLRIDGI